MPSTLHDPVRLAGRRVLPVLMELGEADERLRPDVAAVLAGFPEEKNETVGLLRRWFSESTVRDHRFALAFALGVLGDIGDTTRDALTHPHEGWPIDLHGHVLENLGHLRDDGSRPDRFDRNDAALEAAYAPRI